jgi:predicted nucleic acid-binding protein
LVSLDRAVQDVACDIGEPTPRTLDVLHLASALLLGEGVTVFISYDQRLADAAHAAGLVVATPGRPPPPEER